MEIYYQRACVIGTTLAIPISITFAFSSLILQSFGNSYESSKIAQDYLMCYIPGFILFMIIDATKKFLAA